jgi:hypothetical protein
MGLAIYGVWIGKWIYWPPIHTTPVAVAEWSEEWTVFDRSEAVIAGSNPALGMDV